MRFHRPYARIRTSWTTSSPRLRSPVSATAKRTSVGSRARAHSSNVASASVGHLWWTRWHTARHRRSHGVNASRAPICCTPRPVAGPPRPDRRALAPAGCLAGSASVGPPPVGDAPRRRIDSPTIVRRDPSPRPLGRGRSGGGPAARPHRRDRAEPAALAVLHRGVAVRRHHERPVQRPGRHRHVRVDRVEQVHDGLDPARLPGERPQRGDPHDGDLLAREPVPGQQLPQLQLDQVEQLRVVDRVGLVHRHHEVLDPDSPRQQHVLARLRHHPVQSRDDEDCPIDLRHSGDHVLDVVGVARHVDVGVVPRRRLVLDVGDVDGDAAPDLLGRPVDPVEGDVPVGRRVTVGQHLRDRRGERGLAVVDVPHRADVEIGLGPAVQPLGHDYSTVDSVGWRETLMEWRMAVRGRAPAAA
jgi:hypothetical protein